jgi:hypothetical protein
VVHVIADVLVPMIVGLLLARSFGCLWICPFAGTVGLASNSAYGVICDTGASCSTRPPDRGMTDEFRAIPSCRWRLRSELP